MLSDELKKKLLEFREKRDWKKYHKPKDLALSVVLEAAELLELFQWKSDGEVADMLEGDVKASLSEEIADIAIYLTYLCHDLGIDVEKAVSEKLDLNNKKYPAEQVRGSAKKYDQY
jgi:NTP pyrophosphatase (non-canonical NTP hydrolase)